MSAIERFQSGNAKAGSHDPILRIRFLVPKIGSRRSDCPISRFRFCGENVVMSFVVCSDDPIFGTNKESSMDNLQNLSAPFIFQEECRMKIEHFLFPSVFSNLRIRVSFSMCSFDPVFGTNKNRIRKNGKCEQALRWIAEPVFTWASH